MSRAYSRDNEDYRRDASPPSDDVIPSSSPHLHHHPTKSLSLAPQPQPQALGNAAPSAAVFYGGIGPDQVGGVFMEAPPMPLPWFPSKKYKIRYGMDVVAIYGAIFGALVGVLILFGVYAGSVLPWAWWLLWAFVLTSLLFCVGVQLPFSVARTNYGYEMNMFFRKHKIPYNEICYMRVLGPCEVLTNYDGVHGSATTYLDGAIQIKSIRADRSMLFNPKISALEFMNENIPNSGLESQAPQRDDTIASLTAVVV